MTRMNRLSMMFVTSIMKMMKNTGAMVEPHVLPGMQSGPVFIVSYIILFQSSPVDMEKSSEKLMWKFVKFLYSSMTLPSNTSKNIVLPSTAMIKKISMSRMNTLMRESTDMAMVLRSDYRPLFLLARRSTRLTLSTRKTLASCGPTDKISLPESS